MKIDINFKKTIIRASVQILKIIDAAFENEFNEIWLKRNSHDSLCALTNVNSAFIMYLESN